MKTKLFAALLILLTLAVSIAAAQIDLSPYTMDFSPDARVKLVRPGLIVTIAKNADGFHSTIQLWKDGQKACEADLPDAQNFNYSPFAFGELFYGAYGIGHTGDSVSLRFYRFDNGVPEPFLSLDTPDYELAYETPEALILDKGNGQVELYSWQGEQLYTLSLPESFVLQNIRLQDDGSILAFGFSEESPYVYRVLRVDPQGRFSLDDYPKSSDSAAMQKPYAVLSPTGEVLAACRPRTVSPQTALLTRIDAQGNLLWQKTLAVPDVIVALSVVELHEDGSTTLYGRAIANSQKIYTAFGIEIDAQGEIISREFRDCTTRAAFDYDLSSDVNGQIYMITMDQVSLVIPFEDLPLCNDPGLVLE